MLPKDNKIQTLLKQRSVIMDFRPGMKLNTKFMSLITQKSHFTQDMDPFGSLGSLAKETDRKLLCLLF